MNPVTPALNLIAVVALIVIAFVSYFRRKEAIGGWLLLFFSQMYLGATVMLLRSVPIVARAFSATPTATTPVSKLVLLLTLLRLAAYAVLATVSTLLLRERSSLWVERLRSALGTALLLNGATLMIDFLHFPSTFVRNLVGWLGLLAWLIYFFVSLRVRMVFFSKTWGEMPPEKIFSEG
jgi:hypothetical protein